MASVLYHALGFDHDNVVFYLLSIPAWILPFFVDILTVNKYLLYVLTVGSWALVGAGIDWIRVKARTGQI
nr:hypothetical protein [Paenibacillus turpanensis]